MLRVIHIGLLASLASLPVAAQDHVKWSLASPSIPAGERGVVTLTLVADIDAGWHIYSLTQGGDGPLPLRLTIADSGTAELAGTVRGPKPTTQRTAVFSFPVEWYSGRPTFSIPVRFVQSAPAKSAVVRLAVRSQTCSASLCLPPRTTEVATTVNR